MFRTHGRSTGNEPVLVVITHCNPRKLIVVGSAVFNISNTLHAQCAHLVVVTINMHALVFANHCAV